MIELLSYIKFSVYLKKYDYLKKLIKVINCINAIDYAKIHLSVISNEGSSLVV